MDADDGWEPVLYGWRAVCRHDANNDYGRHVRIYLLERETWNHPPMVKPYRTTQRARVKIEILRAPAKQWTATFVWDTGWRPLFDRGVIHEADHKRYDSVQLMNETWITIDGDEFHDTLLEVASIL